MTSPSDRDTGGHAFPLSVNPINALEYSGMTLRDYFAAKAMQGFAAYGGARSDPQWRPEAAYKWADAMLAAREK